MKSKLLDAKELVFPNIPAGWNEGAVTLSFPACPNGREASVGSVCGTVRPSPMGLLGSKRGAVGTKAVRGWKVGKVGKLLDDWKPNA